MSGYVKVFKVKNGDKDNSKRMSFHLDDEELLEKYKTLGLRLKAWLMLN